MKNKMQLKLQEKKNKLIESIINNSNKIEIKQKYNINAIKEKNYYKLIDLNKIHNLYLNFDNHYMMFIVYRQQRDNIILNEAIKNILKFCSVDKNSINKLCLSNFVKIKNNNTLEFNEKVLPINKKDNNKRIEEEIKILKTYNLLFCNLSKYFKVDEMFIKSLPIKIKKVKNLNDISFLNRITRSIIFSNKIISCLPQLKSFDDIDEDMNFYRKIINKLSI